MVRFGRELAAIAKIAAKDESRPGLACVTIRKGWAVAADGVSAIMRQVAGDCEGEANFSAKEFAGVLKDVRRGEDAATVECKDGRAVLTASVAGGISVSLEGREESVPEIEQLWEQWADKPSDETRGAYVDGRRFGAMLDAITKAGVGDHDVTPIFIRVGPNTGDAVLLWGKTPEGCEVRGAVMPISFGVSDLLPEDPIRGEATEAEA